MVNIWLEYEPDLTKRTENPSFFGQEILFLTGLITYIFYSRYSLKYMASIGVGAEKCSGFIQKSVMTLTTDLQFDSNSMHIINQLIFY